MRLQKLSGWARRSGRPSQADATATFLFEADKLVRDGRVVDAVDLLAAANREHRDPEIEIRLLELRHDAACSLASGAGRSPWPPTYSDPFPDVARRLPEIGIIELSTEVVGGAVAHHGGLLVRGILTADQVKRGVDAIHRVEARRDRADDGPNGDSWYRPYPAVRGGETRARVKRHGGTWLADSPASTAVVLDMLTSRGVIAAVAGHLGERPFFSLQKSTMRHSAPVDKLTAWHQDGSFLDSDVRTLNVWIALSPCGGDRPTPGLEVVPKRVEEILSTDGGIGPIAIAPELVKQVAVDAPSMRPVFEAGDGLIFDEHFVHRTFLHPNMTEDRYAIECWLFAPSHTPANYEPFLV
jgi:hypothetical protein